jgi:hypothetical protein
VAHGAVHFIGKLLLVEGFPLLAVNQHFGQRFAAREAADVGGQDTIAAEDHTGVLIMPLPEALPKEIRPSLLTARTAYVNFYAGC